MKIFWLSAVCNKCGELERVTKSYKDKIYKIGSDFVCKKCKNISNKKGVK